MAFYLRVQAVVLECVLPAASNAFVENEVRRFVEASGYLVSQRELHLQDVWTCRHSRAWWVISSPMIGKIPLVPWPKLDSITKVRQLISTIQPWDLNDERALALTCREFEVFGGHDETFQRFLLNFESCAPSALHAWGSQVLGCECGCRSRGLSESRLREQGLFGCLVRSCQTEFQGSLLRYLHPNEVMMLCAFDPLIDFGTNPRLSLAAAGQMASPLQAAWIFAALDEKIQEVRLIKTKFNAEAGIQAFIAWIIMRGRQVWPSSVETITDPKVLSLVHFWQEVHQLSIHELMHPNRWPILNVADFNIGSILDFMICRAQCEQTLPMQVFNQSHDVPMTILDEEQRVDEPTPWFETPLSLIDVMPDGSPDECLVMFHHEFSDPIKISVSEGCTIQNFVHARAQLVGGMRATHACDRFGTVVPFTHVLQFGQVICIHCDNDSAR